MIASTPDTPASVAKPGAAVRTIFVVLFAPDDTRTLAVKSDSTPNLAAPAGDWFMIVTYTP